LRRYAETGKAHVIGYGREVVGLRKNGATFPISLAVSEMRIDGNAYFTGIIRDITTRKRSEEALLIAASVYRSMGEAILVTDADNSIITVNEPFTQLTGYELHELIGKNPSILASGRQDGAFYATMWHCLKTEGRWQGEIWNRRKNGQEYLESLSISIIYDDNGDVLRHVAVFSEIERP
jgi:PAS domain S-box-containing protein